MVTSTRLWILGGALPIAIGVTGCTPTELEVGRTDPANPAAPAAPPAQGGKALTPGFDPHSDRSSDARALATHAGHAAGPQSGPAVDHSEHARQPAPVNEAATPAWTCPMHPEIRRSAPGNCPICGMKLKLEEPENVKGGAH